VVVTYGGENVASSFLSKLAAKGVQHAVEEREKNDAPGVDAGPRRQGQVIADSTVSTKFLLHLAFVNMSKGIGRGW
jgi:hypothetical protein